MNCSVCENAFIIPKDNTEYNDKKMLLRMKCVK